MVFATSIYNGDIVVGSGELSFMDFHLLARARQIINAKNRCAVSTLPAIPI